MCTYIYIYIYIYESASSAPFRVGSKGADEIIDHHEHINIFVRFLENRSISRGCTMLLFQKNANSRLFFKVIFEIIIMDTQIKDLMSLITTVPCF